MTQEPQTTTNLGLIPQAYDTDTTLENDTDNPPTQWQRLAHKLTTLNTTAPANTTYKLLYLGRHGQGDHNVAESTYGTAAWDSYWSLQEGNGTLVFSDAHLTATGIEQARTANRTWRKLLEEEKAPAPQTYYVSPLYRCLQTAQETFQGLPLPEGREYKPIVKEV